MSSFLNLRAGKAGHPGPDLASALMSHTGKAVVAKRQPARAVVRRASAKKSTGKHDYSSTQFDLPPKHADAIKAMGAKIPTKALAADGRETTPHVTVKYGLHTNDAEKVKKVVAGHPPIVARFGKTSVFAADQQAVQRGGADVADVVKVDVHSPELHALNKKIAKALPHTDTHPEYKPHATIAYVKPGMGKRFANDASVDGKSMLLHRLTFSGKDGKQVHIPLTGKRR